MIFTVLPSFNLFKKFLKPLNINCFIILASWLSLFRYVPLNFTQMSLQERKVGDKWVFQCQHGEQECIGNVIEVMYIIPRFISEYDSLAMLLFKAHW